MTSNAVGSYSRLSRAIEIVFVVLCTALFVYAVLDWLALLPDERGFHPLRMVLLSSALLVQNVASLVQRHSRRAFYLLLATSMALLVSTFLVAR